MCLFNEIWEHRICMFPTKYDKDLYEYFIFKDLAVEFIYKEEQILSIRRTNKGIDWTNNFWNKEKWEKNRKVKSFGVEETGIKLNEYLSQGEEGSIKGKAGVKG